MTDRLPFLPLFLRTTGVQALVVGGGKGSLRKVQTLLEAGVSCTILSPALCPDLEHLTQRMTADGDIPFCRWIRGYYTESVSLEIYTLVIAGTGQSELDEAICRRALAIGKLTTSLSNPDLGNIQFGAVGQRGGIQLSVHTSYRLPEISQNLRSRWLDSLPEDIGVRLEELSRLRQSYITTQSEEQRKLYESLKATIIDQL